MQQSIVICSGGMVLFVLRKTIVVQTQDVMGEDFRVQRLAGHTTRMGSDGLWIGPEFWLTLQKKVQIFPKVKGS